MSKEAFLKHGVVENVQFAHVDSAMSLFRMETVDTDQLIKAIQTVMATYPKQAVVCRASYSTKADKIEIWNVAGSPFVEVRIPDRYIDPPATPAPITAPPVVKSKVEYILKSDFSDRLLHMELSDDPASHQCMKRVRAAEHFVAIAINMHNMFAGINKLGSTVNPPKDSLGRKRTLKEIRIEPNHPTVSCLLIADPDQSADGSAMCAVTTGSDQEQSDSTGVKITHWVNCVVIKSYA